jgi:uncharacterized protein YuzE
MNITYDAEVDILRIVFLSTRVEASDEDRPGVIIDYDQDGTIVGLEILDAAQRSENPLVKAGSDSERDVL